MNYSVVGPPAFAPKSAHNFIFSLIVSAILYHFSVVSSITQPDPRYLSFAVARRSMSRQLYYGRIHRDTADRGYEHLRSITDAKNTKKSSDGYTRSALTKSDAKFEATKHLYLTATRLNNAAKVLEEYCGVFSDKLASRTKIVQKSQHLKRYIVPLLTYAADTIDDMGKVLAPIASVKYVHDRNERKRKSDVVDPNNPRMGPDLQLISDYVTTERKKECTAREVTPLKKKSMSSSRAKNASNGEDGNEHKDAHIILPVPSNGYQYRKSEVVKILWEYPSGSKDRGKAGRKMIRLGHVPCDERTIRRLMERKAKNQPILDNDWTQEVGLQYAVLWRCRKSRRI